MRQETKDDDDAGVIVDGRDQTVIVSDIENGDRALALNGHLIGVLEGGAGLDEIFQSAA